MTLVGRDRELRAALFRLVDVAPACAHPVELAEHLSALLADVAEPPRAAVVATRAARAPLSRGVVGSVAVRAVRHMARRFIVADSPAEGAGAIRRLWETNIATSVDLLGEATLTREEGQAYADRCDAAFAVLTSAAEDWPSRPLLERDRLGTLPRVNLSVKVTALTPLVRADAPQLGLDDAAGNLRRLLRRARGVGAHLHIDMESFDSRESILQLVLQLLSEPEFAHGPSAGIVLQAYLRDSEQTLDEVLDWARALGRSMPLTVRLVKGAYWDHEMIQAARHGWDPPVWTSKVESDRCFERLTRRLIDAYPVVRLALASHNLRSIAHAIVYAADAGLDPADLEFQVLRGLGDDLQFALAAEGLRCRTYCPVGDAVAGMAYLVRRLLENSSNDSFLAMRRRGADIGALLDRP